MTEPSKTTFTYPTRTKLIVAVVLAVAIGGFVLAGLSTNTDIDDDISVTGAGQGDGDGDGDGGASPDAEGVIRVSPRDGTQALAQQELRIQLSPGWTGELTLLPSSGAAVPLPDDEIEATAVGELVYVPAEGRAIERLPAGRNCVRATVWDRVRGREASERLHSWCFDVT